MILHLVVFEINKPFLWSDEDVADAEMTTRQHPCHINEIRGWICGRNISIRGQAMDFMVVGLFESKEDLSIYLNHQNHQEGVRKWKEIASWKVVDVDLGSDTTKLFGLLNGLANAPTTLVQNSKFLENQERSVDFNAAIHKCVIVVDEGLGLGQAANAVSVIGVTMGRTVEGLVGPDMSSSDNVNYPGVIYAPLPILRSSNERLQEVLEEALRNDEIYSLPFSALAQSCKTYEEYEKRISEADSSSIELVAVGLVGPRKKINSLTGSLPLLK